MPETAPTPNAPSSYPRRALVALLGTSPAVVTETLWALQNPPAGAPAFAPTEVHMITTREGQARLASLSNAQGHWALHRLINPAQTPVHLHIIEAKTDDLGDLQETQAHSATADRLLEVLGALAQDPQCAIHASMAGGRKTMGFYMGYILSLLGRAQDRLSHVLVDAAFERQPAFFFPEPLVLQAATPTQPELNAAQARVVLAEVPFLRLGPRLVSPGLTQRFSFRELIQNAQLALDLPTVIVDPYSCTISLEGTSKMVKLEPSKMALYLLLAKKRCLGGTTQPDLIQEGAIWLSPIKNPEDKNLNPGFTREEMNQWLQAIPSSGLGKGERILSFFNMHQTHQSPNITKINAAIQLALGAELHEQLRIWGPKDGLKDSNYGLFGLPAHKLRVL
jgi:CRISPR-associated protein (TIGR02584 family)